MEVYKLLRINLSFYLFISVGPEKPKVRGEFGKESWKEWAMQMMEEEEELD